MNTILHTTFWGCYPLLCLSGGELPKFSWKYDWNLRSKSPPFGNSGDILGQARIVGTREDSVARSSVKGDSSASRSSDKRIRIVDALASEPGWLPRTVAMTRRWMTNVVTAFILTSKLLESVRRETVLKIYNSKTWQKQTAYYTVVMSTQHQRVFDGEDELTS